MASRYRGRAVEVILEEEGSSSNSDSSSDSDDFEQQEARMLAEEGLRYNNSSSQRQQQQHPSTASRPKCEGREEQSNAYGEAMAILDQAALACDREFNDQNLPAKLQQAPRQAAAGVTIQELECQDNYEQASSDVPINVSGRPDPRFHFRFFLIHTQSF